MIHTRRPQCSLSKYPRAFRRMVLAVCIGVMWSAVSILGSPTFSNAYAQASSPTNEALFLAVENNNLTGVRAAVKSGANINARDFNGMQPVDLAIDRGFFDIAHFLISVRNDAQATGDGAPAAQTKTLTETFAPKMPPAPPTPPQLPKVEGPAVAEKPVAEAPVVTSPVVEDLRIEEPKIEVTQAQVKADVKPAKAPDLARSNAQTQTFNQVKRVDITKESATSRFLGSFLDFFKPANTTGIMRKPQAPVQPAAKPLTAEELNQQLQALEEELGPALQKTGAAEALKKEHEDTIRAARIAKARAKRPAPDQSSVDQTATTSQQANPFGDAPAATSPRKSASARKVKTPVFDASKPFNGQVDPEILAFLDTFKSTEKSLLDTSSTANVAPSDAPSTNEIDPFAMTDSPAQNVPELKAKQPPSRKTQAADPFAPIDTTNSADPFAGADSADPFAGADSADPFAGADSADPFAGADSADPFAPSDAAGETDVLKGLLDTSDGSSAASGWDVKKVESAGIPNEVQLLASTEPTGNMLEGVELTLGSDTIIGQEVGEDRLKLMKEDTIHKPCLNKGAKETIFCVDKVSWPFELEEDFLVDTIMYQGTSTVSRYDAGRATNFHSLFKSISFARVVNYYINRFGPPSEVVQRAVAPLAKPRMDNPTYIWKSRESGTDTITSLEIRKFDDERGSFPDTRRGVIMLYKSHAGPIFPQLSQLELMVLKTNRQSGTFKAGALKEESIW